MESVAKVEHLGTYIVTNLDVSCCGDVRILRIKKIKEVGNVRASLVQGLTLWNACLL